jgi:hypothetical protein
MASGRWCGGLALRTATWPGSAWWLRAEAKNGKGREWGEGAAWHVEEEEAGPGGQRRRVVLGGQRLGRARTGVGVRIEKNRGGGEAADK